MPKTRVEKLNVPSQVISHPLGKHPAPDVDVAQLRARGEMSSLIHSFDWSQTPLGPIEQWPQSLKTVVRVLLTSRFAMWMSWGPELTFLYNDAYAAMTLGKKHPWALGRPSREVWAEIWNDIGPRIDKVLATGEATWDEALLLFLERSGYREETYHTFSYSPLSGDDGKIAGHLCVVTEETDRIIGDRRLKTLRSLAAELGKSITEKDVQNSIARVLSQNQQDLPFTLTYIFKKDLGSARLASRTGVPDGHAAAPQVIDLGEKNHVWPLNDVIARNAPLVVENLAESSASDPSGFWDRPPKRAILVPISSQLPDVPAGVLIAALNPYRQFDGDYRGFIDLLAGQIAASIANARAYENERKRAEALAELDKAKTTFFSNISHELRTPLTLLLAPTETALSTPDGALSGEELSMVHRNELRLLKLVNTLLDFSRIEAGRVQATFKPTNLSALTADLASVFRSATERSGLRLTIDCATLPDFVYVDREMWEKIVFNLVSNAFKSTFEGEIAVSIKANGNAVELIVRDTGTGIAADQIPHLFERFRRIEGAKRRSHEGSGIGLALVNELVKIHGGNIRVESELGKGSIFQVSIPFGMAHLPQEQISNTAAERETRPTGTAYITEALSWLENEPTNVGLAQSPHELIASPSEGTRKMAARVLLVDDNPDMRSYGRRLLAARYEVAVAENGKIALEYAKKNPPDLVLTDVMMPEMDGFQLLAALRELPATSTTPIILLSARAGDEARIEGLQRGADDYLTKPFSARELLARVDTHLALSRLRKQALEAVRATEEELRILNHVGATLASELDRKKLVQVITDAGRELSAAEFGAFFYNVVDHSGEKYTLYTISGVPEAAFKKFPMPRNTAIFGPTFSGEKTMRLDDVTQDPRYGKSAPYYGMPPGHLPVHSYLAVPVISRSGEVLGGLFYGHADIGVFTERAERLVEGIAKQAAVALDNARLFEEAQEERVRARDSEQRLRAIVDTTPECVKIVAPDGTLIYMNAAGCAMIGADSPQQVIGSNVYDVIAPEDRGEFRAFNEAICRGERQSLDFEIIGLKGVRRHMETHAVPLPYGDRTTAHLAVTRDVTERFRSQGRIAAQHAITRILSESESLAEAAEPIIQAICDTREWRFGAFWELDGEQLNCIATFPGAVFPKLATATSSAVFEKGIGLPGRVWRTGQPLWITDLTRDENFPRAQTAAQEGLCSGFAFPITLLGKTAGVLELFATDSREPDDEFKAMMSAVGAQIGQFAERKRAERALRQSEEEFRDFAENATIGLHRVGPDGIILWANKAELDLLGYTWEEYVGHNICEFHADAPVIEDMLNRLSCGEKLREYEARMRTKSGDVRYVLVDSSVRFEDGKFIYTRCLTRDISDRKRADDELRRRASQFETVLNQAPIGVFLLDSELRVRQVNPIGRPAFGDIPDLIGREFDEVIYKLWNKEYADEIIRIFRHTLETGEPYETPERVEYRIDRNETEYSEWRVDRIQLPEGGYGVVCYFRDISERVKARIALREQEDRLRKTEKMAAAGQLAASLAHEINNPLSSVTNALYLLKGDPGLHQEARGLANIASHELARVSGIVKQSLSYYRVGTVPKPFDLAAVVEESLQIFSEKFQRAGVQVIKKSSPGYRVIGFADEARQVIDNLLLNAVEATPAGGHLTVSVHPSRNWGNQRQEGVRLTIADTGSGIPKENASKVFEPFFTTKPEKGTGLGLWVVRGIISKHDGTIRVRSSVIPGRSGTAISIFFPVGSRPQQWSTTLQSVAVS